MLGVEIKLLVRHPSEGGFFSEIVRLTDPIFSASFGQLSHSLVSTGTVKGWHGHKLQEQWTYVAAGLLEVVLIDNRADSSTYGQKVELLAGDADKPLCYRFCPGILHGYKCIQGPAHVIYVTSGVFDLENDEVRIAPDSAPIYVHQWSS